MQSRRIWYARGAVGLGPHRRSPLLEGITKRVPTQSSGHSRNARDRRGCACARSRGQPRPRAPQRHERSGPRRPEPSTRCARAGRALERRETTSGPCSSRDGPRGHPWPQRAPVASGTDFPLRLQPQNRRAMHAGTAARPLPAPAVT